MSSGSALQRPAATSFAVEVSRCARWTTTDRLRWQRPPATHLFTGSFTAGSPGGLLSGSSLHEWWCWVSWCVLMYSQEAAAARRHAAASTAARQWLPSATTATAPGRFLGTGENFETSAAFAAAEERVREGRERRAHAGLAGHAAWPLAPPAMAVPSPCLPGDRTRPQQTHDSHCSQMPSSMSSLYGSHGSPAGTQQRKAAPSGAPAAAASSA